MVARRLACSKSGKPELPTTKKYRGIRKRNENGKWRAEIYNPITKKQDSLGAFDTQEEAAMAFDVAAFGFRGHKAKLNFPERFKSLPSFPKASNVSQEPKEAKFGLITPTAAAAAEGGGLNMVKMKDGMWKIGDGWDMVGDCSNQAIGVGEYATLAENYNSMDDKGITCESLTAMMQMMGRENRAGRIGDGLDMFEDFRIQQAISQRPLMTENLVESYTQMEDGEWRIGNELDKVEDCTNQTAIANLLSDDDSLDWMEFSSEKVTEMMQMLENVL